ncbi:MAG: hypothetical protein BRC54_09580 [Cyanobacteria bacterium SW_7_48_12]|nr:MAG: hypothetical protein BRC54_09580 [Cyanobacteria bacterium SW_7_48_12]
MFVFLGQQEEGWEVFRENPNPTASSGQLMPEARNSSASTPEKKSPRWEFPRIPPHRMSE